MDDGHKQCPRCKAEGIGPKPPSEFYKNKTRSDGLSPICVSHHLQDTQARGEARRREAITLLGGCCQSPTCAVPGGMRDVRALQFDHVDGGGRRRQRDGENGHGIVTAILAGSRDFQLLCANCNWIKKHEQAESVGARDYGRVVPTERKRGVGKGRAPGQQDGLRDWWENATPEQKAERAAKIATARSS